METILIRLNGWEVDMSKKYNETIEEQAAYIISRYAEFSAYEKASALMEAGLLAHKLPTRDEIAEAIMIHFNPGWGSWTLNPEAAAEEVLKLLKEQS